MTIKFKKLNGYAVMPTYATKGAAAFDIYSSEDVLLTPTKLNTIGTSIAMEVPEGYEVQIRPRSGLSNKGMLIPNSPGTIDSDYRGEIKILMRFAPEMKEYWYRETYMIKRGDRVAQGVLAPVTKAEFEEVEELSNTARGEGGFGSTGK